jgi:hypothetical protein
VYDNCAWLESECVSAVCSPESGECVATDVANGQTCDDGNACTLEDICQDGKYSCFWLVQYFPPYLSSVTGSPPHLLAPNHVQGSVPEAAP